LPRHHSAPHHHLPSTPINPPIHQAPCPPPRLLQDCKAQTPAPGKLKEYAAYLAGEGAARQDVQQLKQEVHDFASSFEMPGGDW